VVRQTVEVSAYTLRTLTNQAALGAEVDPDRLRTVLVVELVVLAGPLGRPELGLSGLTSSGSTPKTRSPPGLGSGTFMPCWRMHRA
jgi:hypothetical protein